jgi:peptide/nickel transport system permease protein
VVTGYIIRRILQSLITVFIVTIVSFGMMHLVPTGLVHALVGARDANNPQAIAQVTHELGLDKPLVEQYWIWLTHLLQGNFGYDYTYNQSVGSLIAGTLGQSMYIVFLALILSVLIAVPMGLIQATKRNTWVDHSFTTFSFIGYSIPTFFIGWLLLDIFEDNLNWIPEGSQIASFHDAFTQPVQLILPVFTLVFGQVAGYSRYMRSAILDQITQDYVRTAVAKGANRRRVLYRHVLRNAMIPMVTLMGLSLPGLVGGALLVEYVFNIHGIGLLTTNAALQNDYGVTLATTLLAAVMTVIGSLIADVSYAALDPRVRLN